MPTIDVSVTTGSDDGYSWSSFDTTDTIVVVGQNFQSIITDFFARFQNVTIPQGAIIDVAYIQVQPDEFMDDTGVFTNLYFNDIDDAVAPTSIAEHSALDRTTAFVAIDEVTYIADVLTQTPPITTVIQEVIDRPGWVSGNDMMVLWDDDGSAVDRIYFFFSFDDGTAAPLLLHVEYTAPATDPSEMIRTELSDNWDTDKTNAHQPLFITSIDPEVLSSRNQDVIKIYESRPRTKRRADHRYDYATYIAAVTVQVDIGYTDSNVNIAQHSSKVMEEVERIIQANRSNPDEYWDLLETDTFTFQHQYRNFARNIMNVNCKRIVRQIPGS